MRDSFIFYRSFFEAAQTLSKTEKSKLLDAVIEYGLDQKKPTLKGSANGMFQLIKPQLDANQKRFENGKKGGRPKTKNKPNKNQNETEIKPKINQNGTTLKPNVNVNANVNDNVNLNNNDKENVLDYIIPPKPF